MSTHAPLALSGSGYQLEIIPAAVALRDATIKAAKEITQVHTQAEADAAIEAAALLKGLTKECEACRKEIKAPVILIGDAIDAKALEFRAPAILEIWRLESLAAWFAAEQRRKIEEERRKQAEQERKEREAEQARTNAIAAAERAAQAAKGKSAREAAEAQAQKLRDEQFQAEIDKAETPAVILPEIPVTHGAALNTKIEIFTHDLDALYKAHPQCVELKPRLNAIKDLAKMLQRQNKAVEIPGCTISFTADLAVRAARNLSLK